MTGNYRRLDNGASTTKDDPDRGLWYAASPNCAYWTDDWSKLSKTNGIPCCPVCKCVGMNIKASVWEESVSRFEKDNHPRYAEFIASRKEKCGTSGRKSLLEVYEEFVK